MRIEEYKYDFSWCCVFGWGSMLRLSSVDTYFLQRYDKKCTYASQASLFWKIIDLSIEAVPLLLVGNSAFIRVCRGADSQGRPYFSKNERTGVWAALSESSYGGIGFDCDGILRGLIKAKADVRSTLFLTYTNITSLNFLRLAISRLVSTLKCTNKS